MKQTVALIRCCDYNSKKVYNALARQFELLGGLDKFIKSGDSVLLKPNFVQYSPVSCPALTHPAVIAETARLVIDFGARPFIADSPGWGTVQQCIDALGLREYLKGMDVDVFEMKKYVKRRLCHTTVRISKDALDADAVINLCKFKAHQQMVISGPTKNMFGTVIGKQKAFLHFKKGRSEESFSKLMIEIFKQTKPVVNIVDAIVAMQGNGPASGTARDLGWLAASKDPIAAEVVCCELIGLDPEKVPILNTARKINFGTAELDKIEVLGDSMRDCMCKDFILAEPAPISFSLPRICKSITKQFILLSAQRVRKIFLQR